jgi:hypothetical protein
MNLSAIKFCRHLNLNLYRKRAPDMACRLFSYKKYFKLLRYNNYEKHSSGTFSIVFLINISTTGSRFSPFS